MTADADIIEDCGRVDMSHRAHVLIAEDDDQVRAWIDEVLVAAGYDTTCVASAEDALARLDGRRRPNLLVLDLDMPGAGGMAVLDRIRQSADPATVPVIVVSGLGDIERRVAALDAGAVDFVAKPVDSRELLARVRSHLRVSSLASQWRDGADHDPLTGLLNRRGFLARLGAEIDRVTTADAALAVLFIDLDNFKGINDRFGHVAGDRLLRRVAGALDDSLGRGVVLGRWGGDEFVVAVPGASAEHIATLSASLGDALVSQLGPSSVGASIGVSWLRPQDVAGRPGDHLPLDLIEAADRAMYTDKAARSGIHRLP
jgi:diguanylate cyclase (GGDEF)-like protein